MINDPKIQLTRETFGNIPDWSVKAFYIIAIASVLIFVWGVWRRWKLWKQGKPISIRKILLGNYQRLKPRLGRLFKEGLGQKRVRGRGLASWAHIMMFVGFIVLFLGTTLLEIDHLATKVSEQFHFHHGWYYVIYEATLDIFGLLFILGISLFAWRRMRRPNSVGHRASDWTVLGLFLGIGVSGYFVEALRILWDQPKGLALWCSPIGALLAMPFNSMSETTSRSAHLIVWWIHSLMVFGFFAMIPFTRLLHFVTGPINLFFAEPSLGKLKPITIEEIEETGIVGVSEIRHLDQQQLLSLDSCMECGRCEEACPAFASGKPLSPKVVVQDLKGLMEATANGESVKLHGDTIQEETVWSCTSCNACVTACPVRVDPLGLLFDLRRDRAAEGALAGSAANSMRQMQTKGNPWGFPQEERLAWADGLDVQLASNKPDFEILWWVGCAGSFDRRAQKVTRAIAKLLIKAEVNFAVLGPNECCTGDSARRLGDEFLFQELAEKNHSTLKQHGVRKILTQCPHCLNSLSNDYPQFGDQFEVVHHTEFLQQLIDDNKLSSPNDSDSVTYHDPCYLARVNGIHQSPRELLGNNINEMKRHREKTFCCGAGGGRMWMEEEADQRVSVLRAKEAIETNAKTVAVGCPFCLTMMTDGVKSCGSETEVEDVAENLVKRLNL